MERSLILLAQEYAVSVPEKKPESSTSTMMTATRIPILLEFPAVNNRLRSIVVVEYPPINKKIRQILIPNIGNGSCILRFESDSCITPFEFSF